MSEPFCGNCAWLGSAGADGCGEHFESPGQIGGPCRNWKAAEASHLDEGKCPVELVAPSLVRAVGDILAYGATKYDKDNWRKGMKWRRLYGSIQRHLMAWLDKEDNDPESGLKHLAHAACDIAFLIEYEQKELGEDDRP